METTKTKPKTRLVKEGSKNGRPVFSKAPKEQTLNEVLEDVEKKFVNSDYSHKIFFGCIERNKKLQIKAYGYNKSLAEDYESCFSNPTLGGISHFLDLLGKVTVDKETLIDAYFEWAYSCNYSKIRVKLESWHDPKTSIMAEFRLNSENDKKLFKRLEARVGGLHEDEKSIELV
jgi:hypothetical protein